MNGLDDTTVWTVIAVLAAGSWLIRFSFLGLIGGRRLPEWVLRLLRYTPVAVMPGLVAPLVLWPPSTGGNPEPARLAAAVVALAVGVIWRNVLASIVAGAITLYGLLWLL